MNVLPYKPFLIKPNNHELGEIFGVELERRRDVVPYAERLCELESGGDLDQAFRMGLCTGSGSAFSLGLATREQVDELLEQI